MIRELQSLFTPRELGSQAMQDASFATLFGEPNGNSKAEKTRLEQWFDRVYERPFSAFSIEDLARSCRQNLFPEYIVPRVLAALREQPLAGELYDGELLHSLMSLPIEFWITAPHYRRELIDLFHSWEGYLSENIEEEIIEVEDVARWQNFVFTLERQ